MTVHAVSQPTATPLESGELARIDAWWRAANYLSVGQIYLMDNPLLREPLRPEHVKPRLLGHWGTTPGLNFIYAHLNRAIMARDLDMIYVIGPGHGGPGLVASAWLEGTYTEAYPDVSRDEEGMQPALQAVLLPRRHPQPCGTRDPGIDPRGRRARLLAVARLRRGVRQPGPGGRGVVGDGEAETGPLATSWHCNKFVDPARDGAVLPILHLNGYKIANPTCSPGSPTTSSTQLLRGYGHTPYVVEGDDPETMHQAFAATLDRCLDEIARHPAARPRRRARPSGRPLADDRAAHAPRAGPGRRRSTARRWRATWRVPPGAVRRCPRQRRPPAGSSRSGCAATGPRSCSTTPAPRSRRSAACAPTGDRRMSANPHANGGLLLQDLRLPDFRDYAVPVEQPAPARWRRPGSSAPSCAT